jgi:transposase-like protein
VERPPYDQLMAELPASNWSRVAGRYGVSDKAVRKWVRSYKVDEERRRAA